MSLPQQQFLPGTGVYPAPTSRPQTSTSSEAQWASTRAVAPTQQQTAMAHAGGRTTALQQQQQQAAALQSAQQRHRQQVAAAEAVVKARSQLAAAQSQFAAATSAPRPAAAPSEAQTYVGTEQDEDEVEDVEDGGEEDVEAEQTEEHVEAAEPERVASLYLVNNAGATHECEVDLDGCANGAELFAELNDAIVESFQEAFGDAPMVVNICYAARDASTGQQGMAPVGPSNLAALIERGSPIYATTLKLSDPILSTVSASVAARAARRTFE